MVTLRTYPNAIEAGMAKSRLDNRNITCSLADEASNLYGGAPFAMPIRLLVADDQVEEARRILEETGHGLPNNVDPGGDTDTPMKMEEINQQILSGLRELRQRRWWTNILLVAVLVLTVYLISELPRRASSPWMEVHQAMRRYDYDKALSLAKAIVADHRDDYYGHEYGADIYMAKGDLAHAEAEYSRAYELAPPNAVQAKLNDVRKRRGTESTPAPTLSPWP